MHKKEYLDNGNSIQLAAWMRDLLGIRGAGLLIWARIYAGSMQGTQEYGVNLGDLGRWACVKSKQARRICRTLEASGLIKVARDETKGNQDIAYMTVVPDTVRAKRDAELGTMHNSVNKAYISVYAWMLDLPLQTASELIVVALINSYNMYGQEYKRPAAGTEILNWLYGARAVQEAEKASTLASMKKTAYRIVHNLECRPLQALSDTTVIMVRRYGPYREGRTRNPARQIGIYAADQIAVWAAQSRMAKDINAIHAAYAHLRGELYHKEASELRALRARANGMYDVPALEPIQEPAPIPARPLNDPSAHDGS